MTPSHLRNSATMHISLAIQSVDNNNNRVIKHIPNETAGQGKEVYPFGNQIQGYLYIGNALLLFVFARADLLMYTSDLSGRYMVSNETGRELNRLANKTPINQKTKGTRISLFVPA